MGNILSGEGKLSRHQREELISDKNHRRIVWIDEQFGYSRTGDFAGDRHRKQRTHNRRKVSLQHKNRRNVFLRTKSHSLDAIVEELYLSGAEDTNSQEEDGEFNFDPSKSLIPRIKLTRSASSIKEERRYKSLYQMSSHSEYVSVADATNPVKNICDESELDVVVDYNRTLNRPAIYVNDQLEEIPKKPDDNYFAKNFDECMKRLQLIEKEHELIEKDDSDVDLYFLQKQTGRQGVKASEDHRTPSPEDVFEFASSETDGERLQSDSFGDKTDGDYFAKMVAEGIRTEDSPAEDEDKIAKRHQEAITTWYTNLRQQFERHEQDGQEQKGKEMSCRITGATLKNLDDSHRTEDKEKDTRHYFSRLVKSNKSLIDEELPDPDKVKNIRAMFQESLNSTLKRNLGGSLQNINVRPADQLMARPLSAQCNRNDADLGDGPKEESKGGDELTKDGAKDFQIENAKRKLLEKDLKIGRDYRSRKFLQPKWTDTGSVSSGVSSDLSSFDTDLESYSREEKEPDELAISDDDLLEEVKDKHYVQNEVLEKIRYFGTSVTYYGGEMITCSVGPLLSPTTQAIMEEIGEKYGSDKNATRSFDEFYRKYVETNDTLSRKKKVGRTRSFGQNDVFQKPNVLSNTEIEMYKNDLEIEIGIKKPSGIPRNGLKMKITKSASLGSQMEAMEKPEEKSPGPQPETTPSQERRHSKDVSRSDERELMKNGDDAGAASERNLEATATSSPDDDISKGKATDDRKPEETRKEISFARSKSAPEGLHPEEPRPDPPRNNQILFGYEKSLLNGKRKSDMEFEEFEVCETLSEKLEKLEELNPGPEAKDENQRYSPEEREDADATPDQSSDGSQKADDGDEKTSGGKTEKKSSKYNHSRWPIETSVMVDIQKNNEQTPKIVTNGKTSAKTKIRLF